MDINSKEYWEKRFKTNDWDNCKGKEQTRGFAKLLLENLPQWFIEDVKNNNLSICDAGCAEGQLSDELKNYFNENSVSGFDFSEVAVNSAKKDFPNCDFFCADINNIGKKFDVIISSNTLEHFANPRKVLENMSKFVNKHIVLLLPFKQDILYGEHLSNFYYKDFDIFMNDFQLSYFKVIDAFENPIWLSFQIAVIYTAKPYISHIYNNMTLDDIYCGVEDELKLKDKTIAKCTVDIEEKNKLILQNNTKIADLTSELQNTTNMLEKSNIENSYLTSELCKIKKSNMWKYATKYYKVRDKITRKS